MSERRCGTFKRPGEEGATEVAAVYTHLDRHGAMAARQPPGTYRSADRGLDLPVQRDLSVVVERDEDTRLVLILLTGLDLKARAGSWQARR